MTDSAGLRFLYRTAPGRILLKLLVRPWLSKLAGWFLSAKPSRLLIAGFRKKNGIALDGIDVPEGGFQSFNEFFSRKRLHTAFDADPARLISPCDGRLTCFPITEDCRFSVKHTQYSLSELLKSETLARDFSGGTALIFRLAPSDYHRYCFVDDGTVTAKKKISGTLHCVRPIATEVFPVYVQNAREYAVYASANFGTLVQMEVGALLVGKIANHTASEAKRGDEKGFFQFGGSTVILLLQKDAVNVDSRFSADTEVQVRLGECVAYKK